MPVTTRDRTDGSSEVVAAEHEAHVLDGCGLSDVLGVDLADGMQVQQPNGALNLRDQAKPLATLVPRLVLCMLNLLKKLHPH